MNAKKIIIFIISLMCFISISSVVFSDSSSMELYIGESVQLTSKLFDGNEEIDSSDIEWKSDDTSVASVNSAGQITAVNSGDTYIRAMVNTGTHIQEALVFITVKSTIKSVSISLEDKKIFVGEDFVVEYNIEKEDGLTIPANTKVTFLSTNSDVASVDSTGRVKGLKEGQASILVTSVDGGKRDYITVSVSSMVTKIDIIDKEKNVYVGDEFSIPIVIEPSNAILKDVTWSSFDTKIIKVNDAKKGLFKALKEGDAYLRVISDDGSKQDTIHVLVKSLVSGLKLDDKKVELNDDNNSFILNYEIIPKYEDIEPIEKGLTWKSSDTSIATVDENGIVKALKTGLVRIDGTTVDGLYSDYCIIDSKITTPVATVVKKTYPTSVKLIDMPSNVLVGEKIPVFYELSPSNISEKNVTVSVQGSLGYKITKEDDIYYYMSTHEGACRVKVTTSNGKTDELTIFSKSTLKSASIDTGELNEKYGKFEVYLGQEGQLKPILVSNSNADEVILDTVTWKSDDPNTISIDADGNFKVLKNGTVKITMTTDDNSLTETISLEVKPMVESIELPSEVIIGLNSAYYPNVTFELKDDILYGYKDAIEKNVDLYIEEIYVTKEFLKIEQEYEENKIEELNDKVNGRSSNIQDLLSELQMHRVRLIEIEYFLDKSSGDYAKVNYSGTKLTDRDGNELKIAEIKDNKLYAYIVGYVKLKAISEDSLEEDDMKVSIDDTVKSIVVYDELGNLISTSDTSVTDEIKKTQDELRAKMEEEELLKAQEAIKTLKDNILMNYANKLESDIPSDWALISVDDFSKKINYKNILSNFRADITREEFAEIVVNMYIDLSGKELKTIYNNYFTDTENKFVIDAYQLGIVNGTGFRTFSPNNTITRQEMAVMLDKTLLASKRELSSDKLGSNSISFYDESEISSWAKESVNKLSKEYIVFSGVGEDKLNPLGNATREQAIVLAMKILDNVK